MRTRTEIYKIRDNIFTQIASGIDNYIEVNREKIDKFLSLQDVDTSMQYVLDFLSVITAIVKAPTVDGVCLPLFITKIETTDKGTLKSFNLIVRSKIKAVVQYKRITSITVSENIIEDMTTAILDGLFTMYFQEMALQNIDSLNSKISQICKENGIPQRFKFTLSTDTSIIHYIDNDIVIFNADLDKALDITKESIFLCGDEYNDLICKETTERLVALLQTCEITPQLIKGNIPLIKDITNLTTKKRASKLIRETYHRNANALLNLKSGIGYFETTTKVDGLDTKIFALVEKTIDGEYKVILNPFDEITLFNVDFDVLKALGVF